MQKNEQNDQNEKMNKMNENDLKMQKCYRNAKCRGLPASTDPDPRRCRRSSPRGPPTMLRNRRRDDRQLLAHAMASDFSKHM
jgi:hypothetical protein